MKIKSTKRIKKDKKDAVVVKSNQIFFVSFVFTFVVLLITLVAVAKAFSLGVEYASNLFLTEQSSRTASAHEKLIGGQTDAHGCLGPAGYSWCEVKQKCLRIWEEPCSASSTAEEQVKSYLQNNISSLAPEKEVLGGKFQITEVNFLSDKTAFIGYEDGHNLYNAEVNFEIVDNQVVVRNFLIKNKNGKEYNLSGCDRNSDCLPLPSECHPHVCINKKYAVDFIKPEICTMIFDTSAAYGVKDCGCGLDNQCFDRNLNKASSTTVVK